MNNRTLQSWVRAVGTEKAAKLVGVSATTLARWLTGITEPRGNRLALLDEQVAKWQRAQTRKRKGQ